MPPIVIAILGAVGAVAAARWVMREARRINAELHPETREAVSEPRGQEALATLRRDPATGVYRPD